jgi:hypothetical protein
MFLLHVAAIISRFAVHDSACAAARRVSRAGLGAQGTGKSFGSIELHC